MGLDLNLGYTVEEDGTVKCSTHLKDIRTFGILAQDVQRRLLYNEFATATYDIQNNLFFKMNRFNTTLS